MTADTPAQIQARAWRAERANEGVVPIERRTVLYFLLPEGTVTVYADPQVEDLAILQRGDHVRLAKEPGFSEDYGRLPFYEFRVRSRTLTLPERELILRLEPAMYPNETGGGR